MPDSVLEAGQQLSWRATRRSITDMIVCNESRLGTSAVVRNFANARQFSTSINVRYNDLPKVLLSWIVPRLACLVCRRPACRHVIQP